MLTRLFAVLLALCFQAAVPLAVQAQAASPARLVEAMRIPEMIGVMHDEGIAYGETLRTELFPEAGSNRWPALVAAIYDRPGMERRFTDAFLAELGDDPDVLGPLVEFFDSERGRRIVTLEIEARRAMLDEAVEEAARVALEDQTAADDPRLELLRRFAEVNDLVEQNVAGSLNANLAFYRGLSEGGALPEGEMSEGDMLAEIWSQEEDVRAETESWLYPFLSLAYRPLEDADIEAYIAFSETMAAQRMNAALFSAFDDVFVGISNDLGRAAAEMMSGQDI